MAIDLTQFHQTFFEESLEALSDMEAELLRLDSHMSGRRISDEFKANNESLNIIFRAVHSIKGGSSTFGFEVVANFSHILENLLDDIRENRCKTTRDLISILLKSCDCLRTLVQNAQNGIHSIPADINDFQIKLEKLQGTNCAVTLDRRQKIRSIENYNESNTGWNISFTPNRDMLSTGNDPVRIIRALTQLGDIRSKLNIKHLPSWKNINPEDIYLSWDIDFFEPVKKSMIEDVFSWVADDCLLNIIQKIDTQKSSATKPGQHVDTNVDTRAPAPGVSGNGIEFQSIRVSTPKVDALVDLVGELVITQTMLSQFSEEITPESIEKLQLGLGLLERNTRELQESVMRIRMLPVGFALNKLPRIVRDVSQKLGKKVKLDISGEGTELDKSVIESMGDALMHIVRNSVDHGLESPAERINAGKPETGTIHVQASQQGGSVVITIEDDGSGLKRDLILKKAIEKGLVAQDANLADEQIDNLVFIPGFSTASQVTGVSGRGVGMDVVRTRISELGGNVEVINKPGTGTKLTLRLPLTLAIMDGLCVKVGSQVYIIPLLSVIESLSVPEQEISRPAGGSELVPFHGEYLPFLKLYELFNLNSAVKKTSDGIIIIVEAESKKIGLLVDEIVGQQQVVVKSLETHYKRVEGVATATILGDGEVALILDISTLTNLVNHKHHQDHTLKEAS
ncbi:MAG: chemotaxis protein CheA [Acidiferrobacterales bacterium]